MPIKKGRTTLEGREFWRFRGLLSRSDVKTEVDYVAVLNEVLLAFQAPLACVLGAVLASIADVVIEANDLGADKPLFEIGMNDRRSLRCTGALLNGPSADLFRACGKVGLQAKQRVSCAYHAVETRFLHPHFLQEFVTLVVL